jgi:hypothetical protein
MDVTKTKGCDKNTQVGWKHMHTVDNNDNNHQKLHKMDVTKTKGCDKNTRVWWKHMHTVLCAVCFGTNTCGLGLDFMVFQHAKLGNTQPSGYF